MPTICNAAKPRKNNILDVHKFFRKDYVEIDPETFVDNDSLKTNKRSMVLPRINSVLAISSDGQSMILDKFYTPKDFKEYAPYGTCGLAAVATLLHKSVLSVGNKWTKEIGEFNRFANFKDVKTLLDSYKVRYKAERGNKSTSFPDIGNGYAIIRIQWLKKNGTEYYWAEASSHTHYVLEKQTNTGANNSPNRIAFCNSVGWFDLESEFGRNYLNNGYITSYLKIIGGI